MKCPLLVIETPRCGQFGHKFLVSRRDCQEQALAGLVGLAAKNSTGKHFISVASEVQQKSGAALRKGTERIIITGIDTARMGQEKIQEIQGRLNELKPALESLLKNNVDLWQGPSLVVYLHELEKWMEKKEYADLPGGDDFFPDPGDKNPPPGPRRVMTVLAILGVIVICGIVARHFLEKNQQKKSGPTGQGQQVPVDTVAIAKKIAKKWELSKPDSSEMVQKVAKIIADTKSKSADVVLNELLTETKDGLPNYYFSNGSTESELKKYLDKKVKGDVKKAKDLKKILAEFIKQGNAIKGIWGMNYVINKETEDFYTILSFFKEFNCPEINDGVPFFLDDDIKVFDEIIRFLVSLNTEKSYKEWFSNQEPDLKDLDGYLQWSKKNLKNFKEKHSAVGKEITNLVMVQPKDKERLREGLQALENFFEKLHLDNSK